MKPQLSILLALVTGLLPCIALAEPESATAEEPLSKKPEVVSEVAHRTTEVTSWFGGMTAGSFTGKANGLLVVDISSPDASTGKPATVTHLVPLGDRVTNLNFIPDEHEIYDVSTKVYSTSIPNGKLVYQVYNVANALGLTIGGNTYEYSYIDGGCDEGMPFLRYRYLQDDRNEHLVLVVERPIRLIGGKDTPGNAMLKTGSVIVFSHEKPKSED